MLMLGPILLLVNSGHAAVVPIGWIFLYKHEEEEQGPSWSFFGPHTESPVTMGPAVSSIELPPSISRLWASDL
jgi:hypothetical protein